MCLFIPAVQCASFLSLKGNNHAHPILFVSYLYICTLCRSESKVGRPSKDVDIDKILELRSLNFKWTKIASILDISRATLYRRLEENGIPTNDQTPLSEQELDEVMCTIKEDHPNDGETLICGHLIRMGIKLTRQAVRESIHRVDHENVVTRRRMVVKRRAYSVPYPNYIWHIDGHHKLIRWHFVIHGSVDGFSRSITYLKCSDNNRAQTVLSSFIDAVPQFGLPENVRSDHGGENVAVWRYMIAAHNHDYSCVITGSSVHNQRVERLWRDVRRGVVSNFADTFNQLEIDDLLDPINEVDLYCLHFVFLPRIQKCVTEFKESWNHHGLSTEGNMSPYQLFCEGMHHVTRNENVASSDDTSIDTSDIEAEQVSVPRIKFAPCPSLIQDIGSVNPLQESPDNGKDLYNIVVRKAGRHLSTSCSQCVFIFSYFI